jgi:nucleoside-diphosphate-sugar epimerase
VAEGKAKIVGPGNNYMSFVHVEDLAEAYVHEAEAIGYAPPADDRPVTRLINLVDDEPITQKDWLSRVSSALGKPAPGAISVEDSAKQAGELWTESMTCSTRLRNEKAKNTLGWKLQFPSVKEGLPAALAAISSGS